VPQDGAPVHRQRDAPCYENDTCARARLRCEQRVATTYPANIRTVQSPTRRYSKCSMFSVCVVPELSVAPNNSNLVPRVANIPRTAPDPTVWIISCSAYGTNPDVGHLSFFHVNYVQRRPSA